MDLAEYSLISSQTDDQLDAARENGSSTGKPTSKSSQAKSNEPVDILFQSAEPEAQPEAAEDDQSIRDEQLKPVRAKAKRLTSSASETDESAEAANTEEAKKMRDESSVRRRANANVKEARTSATASKATPAKPRKRRTS